MDGPMDGTNDTGAGRGGGFDRAILAVSAGCVANAVLGPACATDAVLRAALSMSVAVAVLAVTLVRRPTRTA